jgi:hypothetical protein
MLRRTLLLAPVLLAFAACGGPSSTLHTLHPPTGKGNVDFQVENRSDVPINNFYLAPTARLRAAHVERLDPDSPDAATAWGPDRLPGSALEVGGRVRIAVPEPGRYDARAVDRDGRYQHVGGLRLGAGGKYILELHEGGWRRAQ